MQSWFQKLFKRARKSLLGQAFRRFLRRLRKNTNTTRRMARAGKKRNPKYRFINKGIYPKF